MSTIIPQGFAQKPSPAEQNLTIKNMEVQERIIGQVRKEAFERFEKVPKSLPQGLNKIETLDPGDTLRNYRSNNSSSPFNNSNLNNNANRNNNYNNADRNNNYNNADRRNDHNSNKNIRALKLPQLGNTSKKQIGVSSLRPSANLQDHMKGSNGQDTSRSPLEDEFIGIPGRIDGGPNDGSTTVTRSFSRGDRSGVEVRIWNPDTGRITIKTTFKDRPTGDVDSHVRVLPGVYGPLRIRKGGIAKTQTQETAPNNVRIDLPSSRRTPESILNPNRVNPGRDPQYNAKAPQLKVGGLDDSPTQENIEDSREMRDSVKEMWEDVRDNDRYEKPQQ